MSLKDVTFSEPNDDRLKRVLGGFLPAVLLSREPALVFGFARFIYQYQYDFFRFFIF